MTELDYYVPTPPPPLEASKEIHLQRELEKLRVAVNKLVDAVQELQAGP